ncbi:molybdopterin-guanine dinucleotide biosynthesis protein B [Pontibacillus halophilus JSM 076056 = DSM 19796]|uniref:Molybdopterin-guanine dinucleotide biosynthesis protein B n=1 Tax=Pontibacillus halophilus JSM 076056 = DSM 19796 TaxID=1385510 RepID=A0A0A5GN52_9BACI|nr:molybdopterin-guanine dinucleotide biosynthesis protein B [Pontibacillus halophilus]KGX92673.1 molybdopterin-guanine dinucleotide biosynthesis protein B [Pontibacillus halophilus JSM 076056 = DSM 19796]
MKVIQIVGYKNSGKTTLMNRLISHFSGMGYAVGSLKHHGHGGAPDLSTEGTDSARHRESGSILSGVEGEGVFNLHGDVSPETVFDFYRVNGIQLLFMEGYKQAPYKKIAIGNDIEVLLTETNNVQLVISDEPFRTKGIPSFTFAEEQEYIGYITDWVRGEWVE